MMPSAEMPEPSEEELRNLVATYVGLPSWLAGRRTAEESLAREAYRRGWEAAQRSQSGVGP